LSNQRLDISRNTSALVLDFDGVMVDSDYVIARRVIDVLEAAGVHVGVADIGHLFGSFENGAEWDDFLDTHLGGSYRVVDLRTDIAGPLSEAQDLLPLLPGVEEILIAAKSLNWLIGIATGQNRTRLEAYLNRFGIGEYFDEIVTGPEVSRGKPAPDIYLEVARRLRVDPVSCLAVEDSLPGVAAATAAGMNVLACPSRVTAHCRFPAGVPVVTSLVHLDLAAYVGSRRASLGH